MENEIKKSEILPEEGEKKSSKKGFIILNTIFNCLLLVAVILVAIVSIAILTTPLEAADGQEQNVIAAIIIAFISGIGRVLVIALNIICALLGGVILIPNILGFVKNKDSKFLLVDLILCSVFVLIFIILAILLLTL